MLAIAANAPWLVEKTSDMGKAWDKHGESEHVVLGMRVGSLQNHRS